MMTVENAAVDGLEYSQHLSSWKEAFSAFYTAQQPSRVAVQTGSSEAPATGQEGGSNPYSAVLTGLQSLLDGPLFKGQQPSEEAIAAALRAAGSALPAAAAAAEAVDGEAAEQAEDEEEEEEEEEQTQDLTSAAAQPSPAARSPPGSRRPRKRVAAASSSQGDEQQETSRAAVTPAAAAAGRPPAAKRRRNAAATAAAPRPPPSSASLNDLATLAAAVAAEETFDDPLLGEHDQEQGILAAYQSGSLGALSAQPEAAAATGRGARGGSRSRKSTPAPSSSGADEGDSLGMSFPLVNEDGKPLTKQQIKRLRRQQSNRESARRSRQRKAEEASMLARRVDEMEATNSGLQAKNAALVAEVQQLRSIIEMMAGDTSALAAQVGELGGSVSAEVMANVNWLSATRAQWLASATAALQAGGAAEEAV